MLKNLPIHDLTWVKLNRLKTAKAILNFEKLSEEMKKAIPEIGKTINSWPQLGSHVLYGGGITADLSRKILLNKNIKSGRYFFDIDTIISQQS